jgi:hypothetical protein
MALLGTNTTINCDIDGEFRSVFRSGQIDRPLIYRLTDRPGAVGISKAALGIDWPGSMRQISAIFIEPAVIYAKEDIHSL